MIDLLLLNPVHLPSYEKLLGVLYERGFNEPYGEASISNLLTTPGLWGILASKKAENLEAIPMGFILVRTIAGEGEIITICTDPDHRREGVAKALLGKIDALAKTQVKEFFLEVGKDNPNAISLYKQCGYTQVGLRKGYYRRAGGLFVDALLMKKTFA